MQLLFIHQNYPGQFRESLPRLAASGRHKITFLTQRRLATPPSDHVVATYGVRHVTPDATHRYARLFDAHVATAEAVRNACMELKRRGFTPDLVVGHAGWGELMFVRDVYPNVPMASYFEYYFIPRGGSVGFDPEFPEAPDVASLLHARTAMNYLTLARTSAGFTATEWQKRTFPALFHPSMRVLHEGIRTDRLSPDHDGDLAVTLGDVAFERGDELITYVARNLEPMRGVHTLLRSLPALQKARPKVRVAIIGGDSVSYGRKLAGDKTYRAQLMHELGDAVDWQRVHFLGQVPYRALISLIRLARAHVYLTVPFVVSWSMMEAMALEKVVIASDVAPVRQFIRDRENGLLVDFFKPAQLADRMIRVLEQPEAHRHLGVQARRDIVAGYDFETVAYPAFVGFLDELTGGRGQIRV